MTVTFGTVAQEMLCKNLAPCRRMPLCSTSRPTTNPGTSTRNTSGIPNESQILMNFAALSASSTEIAPALTIGCDATMPAGRPAKRQKPVMSAFAQSGLSGKRSEEHTSELQSRRELVCRLLLEKKKKKKYIIIILKKKKK